MNLNGLVLVSPFLNMRAPASTASEIDLPHVLYLPTLAATAWYHDQIAEQARRRSRRSSTRSSASPTTSTRRR